MSFREPALARSCLKSQPTYVTVMTSALFSPLRLADLDLANRIVVSPMCQYSANDGVASDWHMTHLGMLANSGAGLLVVEATHVERSGRITHGCLGLYSDACEAALAAGRCALPAHRQGQARQFSFPMPDARLRRSGRGRAERHCSRVKILGRRSHLRRCPSDRAGTPRAP